MAEDQKGKRSKQRDESTCKEDFVLKSDSLPPARRTKDCDAPVVTPTADPFVFPDKCPPALPDDVNIAAPLVIANAAVTVHCGDNTYTNTTPPKPSIGQEGYSVTVAANTISQLVNFTEIPDINGNQLTYISTLSSGDRNTLIADGTTLTTVVTITGLTAIMAQYLLDSIAAAKASVANTALQLALDRISCFYESTKQVAWCLPAYPDADSAVTDGDESTPDLTEAPNEPPDQISTDYAGMVDNPAVVTAGQFRSVVSQNEANNLALAAAEAALKCLYCNDELTRTCVDNGFSNAVTSGVASLDGRVTVGTVTLDANTVCSKDSKEEANILAESLADAELVCFYVNPQVTVDCGTLGRQTGSPGIDGPPYGDFLNNIRGQLITVPAGYIVSLISEIDAYDIAYDLAEAMVDCWICNEPISITCPAETIVDSNGDQLQINASSNQIFTVEACEIKADTLSEANSQAFDRASSLMDCVYCNPAITPKCTIGGSIDETVSVAAGTYCCPGAGGAQTCYEIAVSTSIPLVISNSGIDCRYCNEIQCSECNDENHPPITEDCHAVGGPLCMPAGIFCIGQSVGGLAVANQLAYDLATASLTCFYTNAGTTSVGGRDIRPGSVMALSCEDLSNVIDDIVGRDGKDGKDGAQGPSGASGKDGEDGQDGKNGVDGSPGSSGNCSGNCYGFYS